MAQNSQDSSSELFPDKIIIEDTKTIPVSGLLGYHFPFKSGKGYNTISYNPSYSENRISFEDVSFLVEDINNSFYSDPSPPHGFLWASLLFLLIGSILAALMLFLSLLASIICLVIVLIFVIFLVFKHFNFLPEYRKKRSESIAKIIRKHKNSTFDGKQVAIQMPKNGAYISINFVWKSQKASLEGLKRPKRVPTNAVAPASNRGFLELNYGQLLKDSQEQKNYKSIKPLQLNLNFGTLKRLDSASKKEERNMDQ